MEQVTLTDLPIEILEMILKQPTVSLEDALNVCKCSTRMEDLTLSNLLWKSKLLQKWPRLKRSLRNVTDWYAEVLHASHLIEESMVLISAMPPKFSTFVDISDKEFEPWRKLTQESKNAYSYIVAYLRELIHHKDPIPSITLIPLFTRGNCTLKYYVYKILKFLRKLKLQKEWSFLASLPKNEKLLEKGAVFVSQWCQPDQYIEYEAISQQLDDIAFAVKEYVGTKHPTHSLLSKSDEELVLWKKYILESNQYDYKECKELISCLMHVMGKVYKFKGSPFGKYYNVLNSYIDHVLSYKFGIPITLCIIFESVARRIGLLLQPVNNPGHFLLRYKEDRHSSMYSIMDPYENVYASAYNIDHVAIASFEKVVSRMCWNLQDVILQSLSPCLNQLCVLEMANLVNPCDFDIIVQLSRQYMLHNMDTDEFEQRIISYNIITSPLQNILNMLRNYEQNVKIAGRSSMLFEQVTEPKQRTTAVKFAVGMCVRHKLQNYICVICDWHATCKASLEWKKRMGVYHLKFKDKQPYYSVIANDGTYRYVAQENLFVSAADDNLLSIIDIGRHFSHYYKGQFIPNAEKEANYPHDKTVRHFHMMESVLGLYKQEVSSFDASTPDGDDELI